MFLASGTEEPRAELGSVCYGVRLQSRTVYIGLLTADPTEGPSQEVHAG
jgi:hypothetical protein